MTNNLIGNFPGFAAIANASAPPLPPPPSALPLDLAPALVGYSLRALSTAWKGQNVTTIRRDSDDTTSPFVALASTGVFDTASAATFIGGGSGYHQIWNDQSGHGLDASTDGRADTLNDCEPLYVASDAGINSRSVLDYTDSTSASFFGNMQVPIFTPPAGAFTVFAVVKLVRDTFTGSPYYPLMFMGVRSNTGTGTPLTNIAWNWALNPSSVPHDGNDHAYMSFGNPQAEYGPGDYALTYHVFECVFDPSSSGTSLFLVDGNLQAIVSTAGTGYTSPTTGEFVIGGLIATAGLPGPPAEWTAGTDVRYAEFILYNGIVGISTRSTIRQNIGTYYGIAVVS